MSYDDFEMREWEDEAFQMREWEDEARRFAQLRTMGFCLHGSWLGIGDGKGPLKDGAYYPDQIGMTGRQVKCTEKCGVVFDSEADLFEDKVCFYSCRTAT